MPDSSPPISAHLRSALWPSLARGLLVATLGGLLIMPHIVNYQARRAQGSSSADESWLHAEIPTDPETLEQEAARLSREIEALAAQRLEEFYESSTFTGLPLEAESIIEASRADADRTNSADPALDSTARLFRSLVRMKAGVSHAPRTAAALLDQLESTVDETNSSYTHFIGQAYWEGWNRPQDLPTAYRWFQLAHTHGNPRATLPLIACHAYGIGTPRNLAQAEQLRADLLTSFLRPADVERIDEILAASRIPPPPATSLPARGQISLAQIRPVYPVQLRQHGITGRAVMRFQVDAQGYTHDIEPVYFTHPEFARAATEALTFWRVAARVDPRSGLSKAIQVPVIFNISDAPAAAGN